MWIQFKFAKSLPPSKQRFFIASVAKFSFSLRSRKMSRSDGKVYVGNLPPDVKESDVDDLFYKFGKINVINLKTPSGQPPFAFIEFDDPR